MSVSADQLSVKILQSMSTSMKVVEKIGDAIYADQGASKDTKKKVDHLVVELNQAFLAAIKDIEDYRGK